ncbi:MAG: TolC family protein [Planctomycetes bacterium]|nr:TolC family protein [Planctomycetota bacterium]MCB9904021.1 TolC family protein [Planctomycetota bacterium]
MNALGSQRLWVAVLLCATAPVVARAQSTPPPQKPTPSARGDLQPEETGGQARPPQDATGLDSSTHSLDLTVQSAVAIALVNDISMQVESLASDVARFDAMGSWGAFDWVFDASGAYVDGKQKGDSDLSGAEILSFNTTSWGLGLNRPLEWGGLFRVGLDSNTTETNNQFARANPATTDVLAITYTQPLLRGLGKEHATAQQRMADVTYLQQLHRQRQVRQDVERRVRDAYWDLVLTIEELDVAQKGLELVTEQLARERRRVDVGVGTEVEVLEAQAQVARREEALLLADVRVREAEDAMKQVLFPGTDADVWETRIVPKTDLPESATAEGLPDWTETLAVAKEHRPILEQQRLAIESAELRYDFAKNDARVGLDLNLSMSGNGYSGEQSQAIEEAVGFEYPTYTAGLAFVAPIGNRTRRNAERAARAQVRSSRLLYDQAESQVAGEVRDAVRQVVYQSKAVEAAQRSLEASLRQYEAENARHREGISTAFRLLEFQNQLEEAALSERAARVAYQKALVQLRAAQGLLGDGTW